MANTIYNAFSEFLNDKVNLDNDEYLKKALPSRNWLVSQLLNFENNIEDFPKYYTIKNIYFGSFHRKTKKRPLDDIDFMMCLTGAGSTYKEYTDHFVINVPDSASKLKKLCFENTNKLNSIKIIEKFKAGLKSIDQYQKSDIKRQGEAVTLNLSSYSWNFDIVPAFYANPVNIGGENFYLIPNGKGNWKKTNPEIDTKRTTEINQKNNGKILPVIRLVKYWQKRQTMPSIGSYLLETMILDYYEKNSVEDNYFIDVEFLKIIQYLKTSIDSVVQDPKGIDSNINNVSLIERGQIKEKINTDLKTGKEALNLEQEDKIEQSINKWRQIFGSDFPKYE